MRPEAVKSILTKYFPDGFRPRLNRDYILFRNYAGKESISLPPDNESLRNIIESEGTYLDGSVFIISKELTDEIGSLILRIQDTKADVIFYSPLMNALQPTLSQNHIYSVEMFRDLLQANFPGLYYGKDSFTFSGAEQDEAISAEILRVWSRENALYPAEIAGRLPYIPLQEISVRLKTSPDFVRTAEGKYFLMKRFYVSDSEKEEIFRFVEESCRADGFAAIVNIPCESVRANNYELTGDGIYTAIFGKVLQGKFYRRHKIITDTKEGPDIVTVFRNYCRNRCECTVDELTELCRDLTGSEYPAGILSALYDTMIRISAKTFTEDYSVHFDTDETDRAISLFMAGQRFIPIKGITTFAPFPECGRKWNHYVLESFCYRFSRKYELRFYAEDGGKLTRFNSRNIGIIAEKGLTLTYIGMLAESLSRQKFALNEENAGKYFFEAGLMGKSKFSALSDVVRLAQRIREGRI